MRFHQFPRRTVYPDAMTHRRYETNVPSIRDEIVAAFLDTVPVGGAVWHGDPARHGGNFVVVTCCPKDAPCITVEYGGKMVKIGGGTPRESSAIIMAETILTVRQGIIGRPER